MALTGLCFLPSSPSTTSASISQAITSYLSNTYPSQPHKHYLLDHRLFVDTSSLLPPISTNDGTDPKPRPRQYTHLLTTSHDPSQTYIGTTSPSTSGSSLSEGNFTMITIPSHAQDQFSALLTTKLQPQWAHRQSVILDGVSVDFPMMDDESWVVRVGELRVAGTGQQSSKSGGAIGAQSASRGVLIEIQYTMDSGKTLHASHNDEDVKKEAEDVFRSLLQRMLKGARDVKVKEIKLMIRKTSDETRSKTDTQQQSQQQPPTGWELAGLYMDVLRGTRG